MAQTFNTQIKKVSFAYTARLNIQITKSSLQKSLEEHPNYPSLYSISEIFTRYNIPNVAYRVATEEIDQLKPPFIAYMAMPEVGSDFALVTDMSDDSVSCIYRKVRPEILKKEDFIVRFQNVVFYAEPTEHSGEVDYTAIRKKERVHQFKRNVTIAITTVLFFAILISKSITANSKDYIPIAFVTVIGLITSIILLSYEFDKSNAFIKSICTAGAKTNCDAVLTSRAAKIFGLSWSEIGYFYFATSTLILLMPNANLVLQAACLSIPSTLAVLYVPFSIFYQWRVAKHWCPLCLTIQLVLVSQFIWSFSVFWLQGYSPTILLTAGLPFFIKITLAILFPIITWFILHAIIIKVRDHDLYKNAFKRMQSNPEIFNALLTQGAMAADGWEKLGITIGNAQAQHTILKVCNPYCGPCANAHPILEDIINTNPNVNLRIIFTSKNSPDDRGAPIVKHLLSIATHYNSEKLKQALDDWYLSPRKDLESFSLKYPLPSDVPSQDSMIEAMSSWCIESEITFTPTIFVDGYRLPENYSIEELQYMF